MSSYHFDKQSLYRGGAPTKRRRHSKRSWEQTLDDASGGHCAEHLGNKDESTSEEGYRTDQA